MALHAARLVLDLVELASIPSVDDPLEAPFVGVGFHVDQAVRFQLLAGRCEVGDVDLDVVLVVRAQRLAGFSKTQSLVAPGGTSKST